MKIIMKKWRNLSESEKGSFTIEATILFPIILILTLLLIFFSLVIYQKATLQYSANMIADRLGFVWDNSYKDINTGKFNKYTTFDGGDGLYWRSNQFINEYIINIFTSEDNAEISLGQTGGSLAQKKLGRASKYILPAGATGKARIDSNIVGGTIQVELKGPLSFPKSVTRILGIDTIEAKATHSVTEPTEFIRSTDLVIYLGEQVKQRKNIIGAYVKKFIRDRKK